MYCSTFIVLFAQFRPFFTTNPCELRLDLLVCPYAIPKQYTQKVVICGKPELFKSPSLKNVDFVQ